ncbi:hypothetical protein Z045_02150 [Rhodococcus pyridinivorans KG-16]|uniref:Uncharacterized protein n=1 Tax=Rhodococcus pyridinivorans KG-16 TaxID=1441730 RepID=A0A0V9UQK4_9NOCA|nr:hypothetical protein [Rhodococcus pyridinivorans]KSZ60284.1 hypothetical protein Z045_02150 [Rhodococcus pyridinivorans KG-16]MCR8691731.1 hypothetical protein [Rhodococcus pyridinivorans]
MQNAVFYSLVAMCSLFAASTWCLSRPHLLSSSAAFVASGLWVLMNGPLEGRVLYSVTPNHGLTEADLLSGVGVCIAAWGFWTTRNRRRRRRSQRQTSYRRHPDGSRAMPTPVFPAGSDVEAGPIRRKAG